MRNATGTYHNSIAFQDQIEERLYQKCLCASMQHSRNGKTKQEDDTMISKTKAAWQVQVKSPTHCSGSFLIQKHQRSAMHISVLYATFQNCFKVVRALPQLRKRYETFYKSNSRWRDAFLNPEKSQSQVWCYQNNLRCLYKNNFKRTVFMVPQCIYAPKKYKKNSLTKIKFALQITFRWLLNGTFSLAATSNCLVSYHAL